MTGRISAPGLLSPALGSQCSVCEKMSMSTTPTQKPGSDWVRRLSEVTAKSLGRFTRSAASRPRGKLTTSASVHASTASRAVFGSTWATRSMAGTPCV